MHYEAPAAPQVQGQMQQLLDWFNTDEGPDSIVKAALSHLWFETIHPYEDGDGRVGRNMVDLCLARDAGDTSRLVRISQRLLEQREAYYSELGQAQHGDLAVTAWVVWFVAQVHAASPALPGPRRRAS